MVVSPPGSISARACPYVPMIASIAEGAECRGAVADPLALVEHEWMAGAGAWPRA